MFGILRKAEDWTKKERVLRHLKLLKRLRGANREEIEAHQFRSLRRLLDHSYATVPFYRRQFDGLGLKPEDIKSLDDLALLPPLERRHITENIDELISSGYGKKRLIRGNSSGSTGNPITFYKDRAAYSAGRAAVLMGWTLCGASPGVKMTTIWGNQKTVEEDWSSIGSRLKAWLYNNCRIPAYKLTDAQHINQALAKMKKQNGGYIYGYTNSIYMLARHIEDNRIDFDGPFIGVLTTAENLLPHQRALIERVLGPVYDGYGCGEILGVAFQCSQKSGYHIMEPNVILEKGRGFGDVSEVIVTDLWNYAMPLIRYRIGDLFSGSPQQCGCGCTWNTIEAINGRASDLIPTPNGGYLLIPSVFGSSMLEEFPFIMQYQLAKTSRDELELWIEPREKIDAQKLSEMKDRMAPYLNGTAMKFDIKCVEKIEIGKNGKHKLMIDQTKTD